MPNSFEKEKALELLITEYESLRAEMRSRLDAQTQLTNVALLLIGGVTAATPFLLSFNAHGLQPKVPLIYLIIVLLVISLLFTSIQWAYMQLMLELGYCATYIEQVIRTKSCDLLGIERTSHFFSWDSYHARMLFPKRMYGKFVVAVSTMSLYGVMGVPAMLSLAVATTIYFADISVVTVSDIGRWVIFGLIIFATIYFLTSVSCGIIIVRTFIKISQKAYGSILEKHADWRSNSD